MSEAKISEAVPALWGVRIGDSDTWGYVEVESDADFIGKKSGLSYEKRPLYLHPQPTARQISEGDRRVLEKLMGALPTIGLNGWAVGVEVLGRVLDDSLDAPQPAERTFDVEAMLAACVPGGSIVDPQVVADNIRAWFAKPAELAGPQVFQEHSTHHVYRGSCGSLPCYCWATDDHVIGDEVKRFAATGKQQVGEVQGGPVADPGVIVGTLRAMVRNYSGGHCWDHLDARMCQAAADRIESLEAALAARQPGTNEPADDDWHLRGYAYASKQETTCAGCGKHKHTPLRIDAMGGYVCLTCIDQKIGAMLGEFGYPPAPGIDLGQFRPVLEHRRDDILNAVPAFRPDGDYSEFNACIERRLAEVERLLAIVDGQRDAAPGVGNPPTCNESLQVATLATVKPPRDLRTKVPGVAETREDV